MFKICKRCVCDVSMEEFVLTEYGCNFCTQAEKALAEIEGDKENLFDIRKQIKKDGEKEKYDVLIGLSGGADSSTALHHVLDLGLRPLAFTIDNGYNDPRADENILKMVETLKVPFYRYTIDLEKFKELQGAFIKAGVPNIEIPTDHILMAASLQMASDYEIKWIVSGGNVSTESIMPGSWSYNARDLVHIEDIYGKKVEGMPTCSIWQWNVYKHDKGIQTWYILDYYSYKRAEAIKMLQEKYGWQDTGEKHCESDFTKWFQNYYLFEKFGFDKRKPHYSSMIMSGQMTRVEAMEKLKENPEYPKIGLEEKIWKYPKKKHEDYKTDNMYQVIAEGIRNDYSK